MTDTGAVASYSAADTLASMRTMYSVPQPSTVVAASAPLWAKSLLQMQQTASGGSSSGASSAPASSSSSVSSSIAASAASAAAGAGRVPSFLMPSAQLAGVPYPAAMWAPAWMGPMSLMSRSPGKAATQEGRIRGEVLGRGA